MGISQSNGALISMSSVCSTRHAKVANLMDGFYNLNGRDVLTTRVRQPLVRQISREERKVNTMDSRSRGDDSCCSCCGPSSFGPSSSRRGFLARLGAFG